MASNQKRQKQLQKKANKRKVKHKVLARQKNVSLAEQFERAAAAPILDCWTQVELWDEGIGHVLVSRKLRDGDVAVGSFLVDIFCLGVKDAFARIFRGSEYSEQFGHASNLPYKPSRLEPAAARKLIEGAVEYARSIGFQPHPDYQKAKLIFGDIDPSQCHDEFEYGREGKPFFCAGPFDTKSRCTQILRTLERTCGAGNYDFLIPGSRGGDAPRELADDAGKVSWSDAANLPD